MTNLLTIDPPTILAPLVSVNGKPAGELTGRPTAVRYRALAWLTAAAGLAYLCRNAIGVPESAIREELGLTIRQSSWFLSAFLLELRHFPNSERMVL